MKYLLTWYSLTLFRGVPLQIKYWNKKRERTNVIEKLISSNAGITLLIIIKLIRLLCSKKNLYKTKTLFRGPLFSRERLHNYLLTFKNPTLLYLPLIMFPVLSTQSFVPESSVIVKGNLVSSVGCILPIKKSLLFICLTTSKCEVT